MKARVAPLVSVVIPTYNRGYCIAACIASVLAQTLADFEIIVVDDASSDDTAARVAAMSDPRISYVALASNQGGAVARNTAIGRARGEFVAFLDSDDIWLPDKLAKQIAGLRAAGARCALSYTWLTCVDDDGVETMRIHPDIDGFCFEQILVSNFIGSFSNLVVRRELLVAAGALDVAFRSCQDWDLFIRLCRQGSVHCQREYLVRYLQSVTDKVRISTNPRSVVQGHRRILAKFAADYAALPAPVRRRAYAVFMALFASSGSVADTVAMAAARLRSGARPAELLQCARLLLRAGRRKLALVMAARQGAR
ncbi:glycosyltransferase family 2 protein [Massilia sp. PWRC2]|uniref:glycosyltransferase family 2 protein n=1 Tax=Massilia sp. PWRC2 TaxID=2804626 RepID=UPI003CF96F4E